MALLRHSLRQKIAEPLEAESLSLALVQRALGPRTTHAPGATLGRQRLVDRVKLVLASDLARRWTLAEIAAEVRGSPVYLTQVFQQVEGLPIPLSIALAACTALDLLAHYDDSRLKPGVGLFQSQPFQRRSAKLMAGLLPNSDNRHCIADTFCCKPRKGRSRKQPRSIIRRVNQPTRTHIGILANWASSMSRSPAAIAHFPEVGFGRCLKPFRDSFWLADNPEFTCQRCV